MVINQLNTYPANTGLESGAHLALYVCTFQLLLCGSLFFLLGNLWSCFLFIKSFFWNLSA
jgi:hypothetical protein